MQAIRPLVVGLVCLAPCRALAAEPSAAEAASAPASAKEDRADAVPDKEPAEQAVHDKQDVDQAELDVLTFHRANYLISGFNRQTEAKFQFSFKYDLWPSTGRHTVYLAYTQKSLWDVYEKSAPFRESNYAPEVFYAHYHSDVHGRPNPGCGLFSEQLGVEHESNGEARGPHAAGTAYSSMWRRLVTASLPMAWSGSGRGTRSALAKTRPSNKRRAMASSAWVWEWTTTLHT